jgi:hypothetical protein
MSRRVRIASSALLAAAVLLACPGPDDPPPPPDMKVRARSGALFDLTGTWTRCENGWPEAGKSYWHSWVFGAGTATIKHEVHVASTDCTGATDPAEHFQVDMSFEPTGGDRTVGWEYAPPTGYPATVVGTGATFAVPSHSFTAKGVAFVDDTRTPAWIFVTNPGDTPPPPADADGYPTILSGLEHEKVGP